MQYKILECLTKVIKEEYNCLGKEINENKSFSKDLLLDNLDMYEILVYIEETFDLEFDVPEITEDLCCKTLLELSEYLAQNIC